MSPDGSGANLPTSKRVVSDDRDQVSGSLLICPVCGDGLRTSAGGTGKRNKAGDLPRTRTCQGGHAIKTVERIVGLSTSDLLVRRPLTEEEAAAEEQKRANPKAKIRYWSFEPFSTQHLGRRIHAQLFGILEPDECVAIAAAVKAELNYLLYSSAGHKPDAAHSEVARTPRFVGILKQEHKATSRRHFISIETIRDRVLDELAKVGRSPGGGGNARFRAAHVIYALSTHGRVETVAKPEGDRTNIVEPVGDKPGLQWADAGAFLEWLVDNYEDLPHATGALPSRRKDRWWRPHRGPDAPPTQVVKRHKKLRRRGIAQPFVDARDDDGQIVLDRAGLADEAAERHQVKIDALLAAAAVLRGGSRPPANPEKVVDLLLAEASVLRGQAAEIDQVPSFSPTRAGVPYEPFILDKFTVSIAGAVAGRALGDEAVENIVDWVLWSLNGQDIVLSSQLGAGVAECLRRVDDISYLKWVIVGKELRVASIYREAIGLVNHPSPRLVFDPESSRPPKPSAGPGPLDEPESSSW